MRKLIFLLVIGPLVFFADAPVVTVIDSKIRSEDRIEYESYKVQRTCEFKDFITCRYIVSRNGVNLLSYPEGGGGMEGGAVLGDEKNGIMHPGWLMTGFMNLTAKTKLVKVIEVLPEITSELRPVTDEITCERKPVTREVEKVVPALKDLILMDYTGGAHCCTEYSIYSISPDFKKIFDNFKWQTGYEVAYADLDKDGSEELFQTSLKYDYGFGRPHSDSAFPLVVFKYDSKLREYVPANRQYKDYVLSELNKIVATEVKDEKDADISPVIQYILTYLYLGMDKEAWQTLDKYYKLKNKEQLKKDILKAVNEDPVYVFLKNKN